jgi:uncharacterized membrane protein YdbT with pleckstrin-like domain
VRLMRMRKREKRNLLDWFGVIKCVLSVLVWAFAKLFVLGDAHVIDFMFVVFCSVIIQLIYVIVVLLIVWVMYCSG